MFVTFTSHEKGKRFHSVYNVHSMGVEQLVFVMLDRGYITQC